MKIRKMLKSGITLGITLFFTVHYIEALTENEQSSFRARQYQYNVGYRLLKIPTSKQGTLVVALWYPTQTRPEVKRYVPCIPHLEGRVAIDALPAKGPFPLVVFSHGGIGAGVCAMSWAEALASEGFVVAAPDHKDKVTLLRSDLQGPPTQEQTIAALRWAMNLSRKQDTRTDKSEFEHRPQEIRATVDFLLKASTDEKSPLYRLVDPDHIGLTGVSFGAWTTLVVAGGVPVYHDKRIKAIVPMAPRPGRPDRALIHVPLMTIFGEKETMVLLDKRPNALLKEEGINLDYDKANPPKFLIGIKGAEHLDFDADGMTTRGSLRRREKTKRRIYSTTEVRENDPVIRTIVRYQIAFWRRYLLNDQEAEKLLTTADRQDVCLFKYSLGSKNRLLENNPTERR